MEPKFYTNERSQQIVLSVLKANGIKKVIASPGTTNVTLVGSMQNDPWFEMYSAVDERSAAYLACGLAAESGEPVVLTCTGATASRDYMPGMTEAYYRKLPVLAITANQGRCNIGNLIPQNIDRTTLPNDVAKISVKIDRCKDAEDEWYNTLLANKAVLELFHHGGGPVHIDLATGYSGDFSVKELPYTRIIRRYMSWDKMPEFPKGRVAVFVGSHHNFITEQTMAIDAFCATNDAVVICDHTSGYKGKYAVKFSIIGSQIYTHSPLQDIRVLVHIGEVSGDYYGMALNPQEVWRVSEDGELRDKFRKLTAVFEMREEDFFRYYSKEGANKATQLNEFVGQYNKYILSLPELPFCNAWIAQKMSKELPAGSRLQLGILNSLRSWNWFEIPNSVESSSNVGGFGIDGPISTTVGASLAHPEKPYFLVVGDLGFFYDLNVLGNRHVGNNVRILLVNNGRGSEFRLFSHPCYQWGERADEYMAAAGHYGNQHPELIKNFAENLGYEYLTASNKEEFEMTYKQFLDVSKMEKPVIFEVFTDKVDESTAMETFLKLDIPSNIATRNKIRDIVSSVLPKSAIDLVRKILK